MYVAYFLCDTCGHRWTTHYRKVKTLELGDTCENCMDRLPYQSDFKGYVSEPYFYEEVD
jgi:DNA replicative helicase MCM subunit Mcm2 (Cdc46/Mcm family)